MLKRALDRLGYKLHPKRIAKAIGGALGTLTGATVAALAEEWLDLSISLPMATAIATLLGAVGAYLAPKNREDTE